MNLKEHLHYHNNLTTFFRYETTIKGLEMVQSTLKQQLHDAEMEVKEQSEKHQEILQYSQSLTENNASSKASVAELQSKVLNELKSA